MTNQDVVPRPMFPKVAVAVASEQGRRDENQDWLSWTQTADGELFVIADGMGGYKGGALAAKMTVDLVERAVSEAPEDWTFGKTVTEALSLANSEVYRLAHAGNAETENMGSTALVVLLSNGHAHVAHVGDSRAYLLRNHKLQLLTRDHTRVQQMIDAKMLTPEQARNHPDSHLLSRAIGSRADVEVELSDPVALQTGDALLLCSDGLSGFVTDDQICETLKKQNDVQHVPQALVNLALSAGGNDNITIQFVRVDGTVRERVTARMPIGTVFAQRRRRDAFVMAAKRGLLVFAASAAIIVAALSMTGALAPPAITLFEHDAKAGVLKWRTNGADSVKIEPPVGPTEVNGQAPVPPANTTVRYTAIATATRLMVWPRTSRATVDVPAASPALPTTSRPAQPAPPTSTPTEPQPGSSAPATTTPERGNAPPTAPAPAGGRSIPKKTPGSPPAKPTEVNPRGPGDAAEAVRQGLEPAAITPPGQPGEQRQ